MPVVVLVLLLALTLVQTNAWSESKVYQLSVTIPEHVMLASGPKPGLSDQAMPQYSQTQRSIRNNKIVTITSVVVR